jgi:hypothetical protein
MQTATLLIAAVAALTSLACAHGDPPRTSDAAPAPRGTSPVLARLFTLSPDGETFVRAQDNPKLATLLAQPAPRDVFDAAAAGDLARLDLLVHEDAAAARAWHPELGITPLHVAAFAGQVGATTWLLDHGAPVDAVAKNRFANTPLVLAALTSQRETMAVLIARGADVNAREEKGICAIHLAAANGSTEVLRLLLDHGAAIHARTDDGTTALDVARKKGHADAAALLTARGA